MERGEGGCVRVVVGWLLPREILGVFEYARSDGHPYLRSRHMHTPPPIWFSDFSVCGSQKYAHIPDVFM